MYLYFEGCLEPTNPGVLLKKSAKFNFDQMILMLESPLEKKHPLDLLPGLREYATGRNKPQRYALICHRFAKLNNKCKVESEGFGWDALLKM